jgi:CheY-like chemotaxis protein
LGYDECVSKDGLECRLARGWGGTRFERGLDGAQEYEPGIVRDVSLNLMKTTLLVEHKNEVRIRTKWFLTNFGYAVDSASSAEEALARFDPKLHDIVITDNMMPGLKGTEMAHIIKLRSCSTPVLMYTGLPPEDQSCLDIVVERNEELLVLKQAVEWALAIPVPASA